MLTFLLAANSKILAESPMKRKFLVKSSLGKCKIVDGKVFSFCGDGNILLYTSFSFSHPSVFKASFS